MQIADDSDVVPQYTLMLLMNFDCLSIVDDAAAGAGGGAVVVAVVVDLFDSY